METILKQSKEIFGLFFFGRYFFEGIIAGVAIYYFFFCKKKPKETGPTLTEEVSYLKDTLSVSLNDASLYIFSLLF